MSYKKCSRKIMTEVMDEFKENKLKSRKEEIIKNKKQALAIGLSIVEKKCEYSKDEYKQLEEKVLEFLKSKPDKKIPLSSIIQTKHLIEYYYKKKDYKKCKKIEILLWHYIVSSVSINIKITNNIWSELKAIKKLDFKRF
jgi:hypothetical protein